MKPIGQHGCSCGVPTVSQHANRLGPLIILQGARYTRKKKTSWKGSVGAGKGVENSGTKSHVTEVYGPQRLSYCWLTLCMCKWEARVVKRWGLEREGWLAQVMLELAD